jgi:hypothetical protein
MYSTDENGGVLYRRDGVRAIQMKVREGYINDREEGLYVQMRLVECYKDETG